MNAALVFGERRAGLAQAFGGIDGAAESFEGHGEKASRGDEGDEHIPREVGGFTGGDVIEQFRGGDADAGIDPWRGDSGAMFLGRAFEEADDASLGIQGDGAVGAGARVHEQGGQGVSLVVEANQGG